ncbi:alpha/beta hydrolase [Gallaecimonas kandeliae]|uniref:alpha/beta fold hydrolase n=1 Tax=Gallaecimonas kandeliae TaxID=3029055 RepID=UPI0026470731|nr:alpha/beta hydrolase [Gallaecimonas kandeliae]WKE67312.1 alpha/beta hydrolase [Gallaecimonas kandeliae]
MFKRIFLVMALVLMAAFGLSYNYYKDFQQAAYHKWAAGSRLLDTPSGPLEYQSKGSGVPVLQFHGTPSSYRGNLNFALYDGLFTSGYRLVSASRPGYMRSPLSTGKTPAAQADAFSSLADELHLGKVVVVGISGGGPSALAFVHRHPNQCRALVLIEALALPISSDGEQKTGYGRLLEWALDNNYLTWLASGPLFRHLFPQLVDNDDKMAEDFGEYLALFPHFEAGLRNDVAQFQQLKPLPQPITSCPTLILHGLDDQVVPFGNATAVLAHIPGAKLVPFAGSGHEMFYSRAGEIQQQIRAFLGGLNAGR